MTEETARHRRTKLYLCCSASLCFAVFSVSSAPSLSAHANSVSYAQYAVDGRIVHAVVRLPLDDVDLLLRLDLNEDDRLYLSQVAQELTNR